MSLRINALSLFILPRLLVQVWEQSDFLFEKDHAFVIIRRIDVKMQAAKSDWRKRNFNKLVAPENLVFCGFTVAIDILLENDLPSVFVHLRRDAP